MVDLSSSQNVNVHQRVDQLQHHLHDISAAPNFSESEPSEPRKYQGLVRFVVSYGAFVDVGTHLGLLHQTRISLEAIDCVNDVLYEGQQVRRR